jgi:hypothetical protein
MEGRASREQPLGGGFGRSSRGGLRAPMEWRGAIASCLGKYAHTAAGSGRRWSGGAVAGRFDNSGKLRPVGSGWAPRPRRRVGEPGVWIE